MLVRPFTPDDVASVAELRGRVFRQARRSGAELQGYLRQVFFESPWHDPELPALVADDGGTITGFVGVVPRPFTHGGQRLRGAVATQIMVAPESRGLTGLRLMQGAFAGPQDLLFADVVNPVVRRVWERSGGSTALLYGFHWIRTLRPARHAAAGLGQAPLARGTRFLAGPLFRIADSVAAPQAVRTAPSFAVEPMADLGALPALLARTAPRGAILPVYDPDALAWLMEHARERWRDERVEAVLVRGADGEPVGCFIYLNGGAGTAQVLQLAALPPHRGAVLRQLFRHAWQAGAAAVRGRADPLWMDEVGAAGCRWERSGEGIIVHARRAELLAALLRGDAVLGGLDGEWWLDF
ncbi:MAG TPA: GNAT family N-acetyltransferase [Longimicrobium sp.]|nr:GNAT family N-acetyltransferase [Longimicrobium sp.]